MDAEVRKEFDEIRAILRGVAERQAAAEERMDRADERMDRAEERMAVMDARFEKRMRGFEKLVQIGMREMISLRRAQRQTELELRAFIASLRRGGNGRNGGRVN
ncbi:MAG TPA: hypothetical protein VJN43_19845 [Bryobacteraceae bacterium]|nr:hypothetical protein [Bryobacteraceae bacterium]